MRFAMRVEAAMEMGKGILRWDVGVSVASFGGGESGQV